MRVFGRGKRWFEQTEGSEHQQAGYCEGMSDEGAVERDRSTYKMQSYKDRMTRRLTTGVRAIRVAVGKERKCSDAGDVRDDGAQRRGR